MSKSRWSKMTDAEKKAYYAARKARKAAKAKAKAVDPAKKPDTKKPAPKACKKACPCKAEPKNVVHVDAEQMSVGEKAAFCAVKRATDERVAVEKCVSVVSNALMDLVRTFRPGIAKIVIEHKDAPAPVPAKKVPAKK